MQTRQHSAHRGFSLIELLIVILIIALIVAIVLPALSGSKNLAKRADTESLFANISSAIGSYKNDNHRLPGRFTVREMAAQDNLDNRGMSMAENVMLDLGAMRTQDTAPTPATGWLADVRPQAAGAGAPAPLWVKPDEIESGGKAYFTPPAKYYVAQDPLSQVGSAPHTGAAGALQLADLVDSFGNPVLIWLEDEASIEKPMAGVATAADAGKTVFARSVYDPAAGPAKFYWATNAGFLKSTRFGKGAMDLTSTDPEKGSFLGGAIPGPDQLNALAAFLGNPGFPVYSGGDTTVGPSKIWPEASRGSYSIHSAGIDGTFLGRSAKKNRGATFTDNGKLIYGSVFKEPSGKPRTTPDGKTTTIDFAREFDDILVSGS